MRILSSVQPTAASLEAVRPAWVEGEKGKGENTGEGRGTGGHWSLISSINNRGRGKELTVSLDHLAKS